MRVLVLLIFVVLTAVCPLAQSLPGDADANGTVDLDDARMIARYLTKQVVSVPSAASADATQDGEIDMEDAFAIAQRTTGRSAFMIIAPVFGNPAELNVGKTLRIEVFERFFP